MQNEQIVVDDIRRSPVQDEHLLHFRYVFGIVAPNSIRRIEQEKKNSYFHVSFFC